MRTFGLVVALLACYAGAMPAAATALASSRCPSRGAHVLLHDAGSVVYWFPHRGESGREEGAAVYACTRGHRAVVLHEVLEYEDVGVGECTGYPGGCLPSDWRHTIALAGAVLAYATESSAGTRYSPCDCTHWGITVVDLSTGRVVHRVPTGPHHGTIEPEGSLEAKPERGDLYVGVGRAEQVVVESDGSVAWVAENFISWLEAFRAGREHEPRTYELRAIDQGGERRIASGPTLDPHSLAFHGSRLEYAFRYSTVVQ